MHKELAALRVCVCVSLCVHLLICPIIVHSVESAPIMNDLVGRYVCMLCCPLMLLEMPENKLFISSIFS